MKEAALNEEACAPERTPMKPGDKVYVTKYALTDGIRLSEVQRSYAVDCKYISVRGYTLSAVAGRDAHATWPEALAAAEQMRTKKIASLRKQIEKLEAMTFEEPKQ